jgi:cytochrome c-type biogenesis protein CcmH
MLKKTVAGMLLGWLCVFGHPVLAADAPSAAADPLLEKRVMAISEELRCLVCQNQTIADSHAELAIDLKNQVREMLQKGKSEQEIKRYMVERYGDFVLYRPAVQSNTWLLWLGPFALLLGGLSFLLLKLRQRNRKVAAAGDGMSAEAQLRAERLLGNAALAPKSPSGSAKDKAC